MAVWLQNCLYMGSYLSLLMRSFGGCSVLFFFLNAPSPPRQVLAAYEQLAAAVNDKENC